MSIECKFPSSNESFYPATHTRGEERWRKGRRWQICITASKWSWPPRKERAARAALRKGIKPLQPSWTESDEEAYGARLAHWQAASRALVDALNRLRRTGERVSR